MTIIIVAFILGMLAMFVEMFLPGVVLGTIGFLVVVGSIVYAFVTGYNATGVILALCTLGFLPVFFLVWKGVIGRYFALKGDEKGYSPSTTLGQELVGAEGVAMSPLRPSGIARLNDRRCDVITTGDMLEKGTRIKVVEVSGNRIVVKRI